MLAKLFLAALLIFTGTCVRAQSANELSAEWITLGTMAGPWPDAMRSQAANAIVQGDNIYLVDVGDGAVGRLTTAGLSIVNVRAVFISHLHFDHTGGLAALLGLRQQISAPYPLTIYGPSGMRRAVDGLNAYIQVNADEGIGLTNAPQAGHNVAVVEIENGSTVELSRFTVTAAENSHYIPLREGGPVPNSQSLSLRFDFAGRSIVYTGDTGPSSAVEQLARGADILIAEMMDPPVVIEHILQLYPEYPQAAQQLLTTHLIRRHLTPRQIGEMATNSAVGQVVITHTSPVSDPMEIERYEDAVRAYFDGDVSLANDLDHF